jgi:hypothetical protein
MPRDLPDLSLICCCCCCCCLPLPVHAHDTPSSTPSDLLHLPRLVADRGRRAPLLVHLPYPPLGAHAGSSEPRVIAKQHVCPDRAGTGLGLLSGSVAQTTVRLVGLCVLLGPLLVLMLGLRLMLMLRVLLVLLMLYWLLLLLMLLLLLPWSLEHLWLMRRWQSMDLRSAIVRAGNTG